MKLNNKLINPIFLAGIFLLMLNDFALKSIFHNAITGKLSDFAWLFAMPFFLSSFYEKQARTIHFLVGLFFVFGKSELSQPIINALNSIGFNFHRIVDFTDNICLISVFASYYVLKKQTLQFINPVFGILSIVISSFAFVADTQVREPEILDENYVEPIENTLKTISLINISNETKIAIIDFKYSKEEIKKLKIKNTNFSKINTLIILNNKTAHINVPIYNDNRTKFPKSFSVKILDTLGNKITEYNKSDFLECEYSSNFSIKTKELYLDEWQLKIGFEKSFVSLENLIGNWKITSGKNHYDFELMQSRFIDNKYNKPQIFTYDYSNNTLKVNDNIGKIIRLKNDRLTINWNKKDTVKYIKH